VLGALFHCHDDGAVRLASETPREKRERERRGSGWSPGRWWCGGPCPSG
jgi:hypothetical protein